MARRTLAGPTPHSNHDHHRRIVGVEPPGAALLDGPFARVAAAIRRYDVFPPGLGRGRLRRPVEVGDTVGLRYYLFPGLHIFFASRVSQVFQDELRSGFTYQTLQGHPEIGEETFAVSKDARTGAVTVSLTAWSELGLPFGAAVRPLARRWQLAAGRLALDHLERLSVLEMSTDGQPHAEAIR